ncbi:MAG: ParB N-terminal domain-containing protein [Planctomycetes bacterium]|nr:ParB N-terminal domain-containing protein [Planctomycetota bacterium]
MKVEQWHLARIKPYDKNPRINDHAVEAVAASIREFGFRQPIVVDEDGVIVVGHTRYKAARKLGLKRVPVHVASGLTPARIKAYRLADNKTAELADWDPERLVQEILELKTLDFDVDLLGFSSEELDDLLHGAGVEPLTDPDDIPAPPDTPITRAGDLWTLGRHRLLCGDAGKAEDVDRLLAGATIQLEDSMLLNDGCGRLRLLRKPVSPAGPSEN